MIYAIHKRTKEHLAHSAPCLDDVARCPGGNYVQADADGWIEWGGGGGPLPDGAEYDAKTSGGGFLRLKKPEQDCWRYDGDDCDIIAYRPILNHHDQPKEWRGPVCIGDAVKVTMDDPAYDNRRPIIAEIAFMDDKGVFLKSKELIGGCIGLPHKMVTLEKAGTERDRWIEAAMKQCNAPYISPPELAEAIYTALQNGDLPMTEE